MMRTCCALWGVFSLKIFLLQIVFLISGITTTLGNQMIMYNGINGTMTFLPAAAVFLGNLLAFFTPRDADPKDDRKQSRWFSWPRETFSRCSNGFWLVLIGVLEILGYMLSLTGISVAGSGLFQVIYSSIVVWIAILSRLFLKTTISWLQWLAILIVTVGVAVSASGTGSIAPSASTSAISIIVLCTFVYSMSYTVTEKLISGPNPPAPQTIQGFTGLFSFVFALANILAQTVPKWKELVADKVAEVNGSWTIIVLTLIGLTLSALSLGWAYYKLLKYSGAVTAGILQSLRAVSVFYVSSYFFCSTRPEQCLNSTKLLSTFLVVVGVLLFSYAKSQLPKPKSRPSSSSQTLDV